MPDAEIKSFIEITVPSSNGDGPYVEAAPREPGMKWEDQARNMARRALGIPHNVERRLLEGVPEDTVAFLMRPASRRSLTLSSRS